MASVGGLVVTTIQLLPVVAFFLVIYSLTTVQVSVSVLLIALMILGAIYCLIPLEYSWAIWAWCEWQKDNAKMTQTPPMRMHKRLRAGVPAIALEHVFHALCCRATCVLWYLRSDCKEGGEVGGNGCRSIELAGNPHWHWHIWMPNPLIILLSVLTAHSSLSTLLSIAMHWNIDHHICNCNKDKVKRGVVESVEFELSISMLVH